MARRDVAYGLVIVWALFGVVSKGIGNQTVVFTAQVGMAVILVAVGAVVTASRLR